MFYSQNSPLIEIRRREKLAGSLSFFSCDTEENYIEAKKRFGSEWYYHDNPIDYSFNSYGYRTIELEEIKDDFIIGFGCSYSMGVGLHKEDIWVEKLGKKLNKQVVNLSLEGIGNTTTFYNNHLFYSWCKKNNKIPSGVFIQLTFNHRREFFHTTPENEIKLDYTPSVINEDNINYTSEFYNDLKWFEKRYNPDPAERTVISDIYTKTIVRLWETLNVPVYFFQFGDDFTYNLLYTNNLDIESVSLDGVKDKEFARDLQHNGRKEHELVAEVLALKYNKNG